jgi:hypothetical protein
MTSILEWFKNLKPISKAAGFIALFMLLLGIATLVSSFFFLNYTLATQLFNTAQGDLTYIMIGLRNCGLAGSVTIIAVSALGMGAFGSQNMALLVLYIIGCVIAMIGLIITAVIPLIYAAIIALECLAIQLICCPSTNPNCLANVCKYDVPSITYFCTTYFNLLYFIVVAFFFMALLSLANSIVGCVAACNMNKKPKDQTTIVVQNQNGGGVIAMQQYPGQPMMGQPYPGQPYPGQPMMGQPYPGQPMMGQPMMGQPSDAPNTYTTPGQLGDYTNPPSNLSAQPPNYPEEGTKT